LKQRQQVSLRYAETSKSASQRVKCYGEFSLLRGSATPVGDWKDGGNETKRHPSRAKAQLILLGLCTG
jgi:hypothetical protein